MLSYQFAQGITDHKDDMYFAVVEWPWKYIHHRLRPEESELYDLERDPRELDNRIATDPERAARMLEALSDRPYLPDDDLLDETMSEEDRKRLEALGYVK